MPRKKFIVKRAIMNNHKDEDLAVEGLCVRVFGGWCAVEYFFGKDLIMGLNDYNLMKKKVFNECKW